MNMNVDSRHMIHFWCHWRIKIYLELTIPSAVIRMHFKMWELFADNQFLLHILTLCDTKCYRNKLNYLLPSCCHTCILMKQNLELFFDSIILLLQHIENLLNTALFFIPFFFWLSHHWWKLWLPQCIFVCCISSDQHVEIQWILQP